MVLALHEYYVKNFWPFSEAYGILISTTFWELNVGPFLSVCITRKIVLLSIPFFWNMNLRQMCDRIPEVRDILSVSPAGMTQHNIPEDQSPQYTVEKASKFARNFFPYCKINGENWTRT
jgi:hypothetical protein